MLNPAPANQMALNPATIAEAEALILDAAEAAAYGYGRYVEPNIPRAIGMARSAAGAYGIYKTVKPVAKRAAQSLSRARKMARSYNPFTRSGRAHIGSAERRAGLRRAKRPPPRGRGPAVKLGPRRRVVAQVSKTRRFRKPRRVKRPKRQPVKRHFDDYGSLDRDHCGYIGFSDHGSVSRMWASLGDGIARMILAKVGFYPRAFDQVMDSINHVNEVYLEYKRINVPGGDASQTTATFAFTTSTTFGQFSALLAQDMQLKAESGGAAEAYYLSKVVVRKAGDVTAKRYVINDVADSTIEYNSYQHITIRNMTPNNDGGDSTDVTGINPVKGKMYKFRHFRPKIIDEVRSVDSAHAEEFSKTFANIGVNRAVGSDTALSSGDVIATPPVANKFFSNCASTTPIYMGVGENKVLTTTFKMRAKLSAFIERFYYSGFEKGTWGACTWLAFERAIRQGATAAHTAEDSVRLDFDRKNVVSCVCTLPRVKTLLDHYQNQDMDA